MEIHSISTFIKGPIIFTITLTLAACGGGDSDTSPTNSIPADFDLFSQTGTWQLNVDTRLDNLATSFNFDGQTITRSTDLDFSMLTVGSLVESGNQVISDNCDVAPAETLDKTDFTSDSIADITDDLIQNCSLNVIYTKTSNLSYQINASCGADFSMDMNFSKLSDTASLDFGALSFTSSDYDDLSSSSGSCGNLINSVAVTTVTPQPNTLNEPPSRTDSTSIVEVVAPYSGNRIAFEFNLSSNPVVTGTYNVVAGIANANEAEVAIGSFIFGGTVDEPQYIEVQYGTVTIASASSSAVSGSFDLNTQFNGSFIGTFAIDIQ